MASATFEGAIGARKLRAALAARRATAKRNARCGPRVPTMAVRRPPRNAQRARRAALWRGVCASVAIAGGYVALVSGLRWLLAVGL